MIERVDQFQSNPARISPETLEELYKFIMTDTEESDYERWEDQPWAVIVSGTFQAYKIKAVWQLPNPQEIKKRDGSSLPKVESDSYGYISVACGLRSYIAGAFAFEAKRNKIPPPQLNEEMKYINIIPEKTINEQCAEKEGVFMINQDSLLSRWNEENPEFYEFMTDAVGGCTDAVTKRVVKAYSDELSKEMFDLLKQRVEEDLQREFTELAVHTYAMFTPNPPEKIPVPVGEVIV